MTVKTWTMKIAGASLVATLLAGVGMGAALAATPTTRVADPVGQATSQVTNLTPYTWTLWQGGIPSAGPWVVKPPITVSPGQTATWLPNDTGAVGSWNGYTDTDYLYTDAGGQVHVVDVGESQAPNDPDFQSHSFDRQPSGMWVESSAYHMAWDPDGNGRHVDAIWNSPASITIDANTDPDGAQGIVNSELPRVSAANVTWVPSSSTPTFKHVNSQQISSTLENYSSAPATLAVNHDTTAGESTTIGEEASASLSTDVFGFVAKVTATVTGEQEWGSGNSLSISQHTEIGTGCSGYLYSNTSIATVTGTLTIKTPEGVTFTVKNVSITRGDIVDPGQPAAGGINITGTEAAVPPLTTGSGPTACTPPAN